MGCGSSTAAGGVVVGANNDEGIKVLPDVPDTSIKRKLAVPALSVDYSDEMTSTGRSRSVSQASYSMTTSVGGLDSHMATPAPEFSALRNMARRSAEARTIVQLLDRFEHDVRLFMEKLGPEEAFGGCATAHRAMVREMEKGALKLEMLKREGKFRLAEKQSEEILKARLKAPALERKAEEEKELAKSAIEIQELMQDGYRMAEETSPDKEGWKEVLDMFEAWPWFVDLEVTMKMVTLGRPPRGRG